MFRRGKPVPWVAEHDKTDDAPCWSDDELEIFFSDASRRVALHFGVSAAGGRFEGLNKVAREGYSDMNWDGRWTCAVRKTPEQWRAEIVIPRKTLTDAGLAATAAEINFMSQNVTGVGQTRIYLAQPGPKGFGTAQTYVPLVMGAGGGR